MDWTPFCCDLRIQSGGGFGVTVRAIKKIYNIQNGYEKLKKIYYFKVGINVRVKACQLFDTSK